MARELIDIDTLASLLKLSTKTIRNKYSNPETAKHLPPRVVIPGIDRLLFDSQDVEKWQNGLQRVWGVQAAIEPIQILPKAPEVSKDATTPRKRGRPTNAERFAAGTL